MANPLTTEDLKEINASLAALDEAEQDAQLAMQAGIDVQAQLDEIRTNREKLLRIKSVYFPGQ